MIIGSHPMSVTPVTNSSVRYTTKSDIANPKSPSVSHRIGRVMSLRAPQTMRFTRPRINVNTKRDVVPAAKVTPCRYPYWMRRYIASAVSANLKKNLMLGYYGINISAV